MNGKSDILDAENTARAVLAGFATATPKIADGDAEMIRRLKIVRDQAVEQRTSAMITMKAMLVHASDTLRRETSGKTHVALTRHLAGLHPRGLHGPEDALRHALRMLAKRWQYLNSEAKELTEMIGDLVHRAAPELVREPRPVEEPGPPQDRGGRSPCLLLRTHGSFQTGLSTRPRSLNESHP